MPKKIFWTPLALQDLSAIRGYIQLDKPKAAKMEAGRIKRSVERLKRFPLSGRPSKVPGIREVISGNFRVFYRAVHSQVQILRIYHSRRNIQ